MLLVIVLFQQLLDSHSLNPIQCCLKHLQLTGLVRFHTKKTQSLLASNKFLLLPDLAKGTSA